MAVVANIPGGGVNEYQRTGERDDPEAWLGWFALALTLACLVWVRIIWVTRPDQRDERSGRGNRLRILASAVLAAGCAGALVVVAVRLPSPSVFGGRDLSRPLMMLAFALAGLGGLVVAVDGRRRPAGDGEDRDTPPGRAAVAGTAAAVALLAAAVAVGVVPAWTVRANTGAVTTDRPRPVGGVPKLTGTVAWSAGRSPSGPTDPFARGVESVRGALSFDPTRTRLLGTAGGLAVLEARGLRMLDPASGAQRWAFHRWDVRHFGPRHRPNAADVGSAVVSPDGRWLAMTVFVDAPRSLFIDGLRDRTLVWVFDTVSGRRRADFAVPDTARIVGAVQDRVMIHTRSRPSPEQGSLTMFTFDGETKWRYTPGAGCSPTRVFPAGDDLLTTVSCRDEADDRSGDDSYPRHRLARIDGGTGRPRWSWQLRRDGTTGSPGERFQQVSVAVTEGTAVVDARVVSRWESDIGNARVTHNLFGVRVADGRTVWTLPDQRYGDLRSDDPDELGPLHTAAGTAVFAENLKKGKGDYVTALRAFDAQTGKKTWSLDVPDIAVPDLDESPGPAVQLRDGRLLMAYQELTDEGEREGCAMATWDIATGERGDLIRPNPIPDETWCLWARNLEVVELPGAVAVLVGSSEAGIFVLS